MAEAPPATGAAPSATGAGPGPLSLAHRSDFRLGNATIRPSLRAIEGPDARVAVEPRVMQVLLALVDARAVLSRDDLIRICWNGIVVGDDAINRAIGELRRAIREAGADFAIETIPRIGYRVAGDVAPLPAPASGSDRRPRLSRRTMIGGGAAALGAAGLAVWTFGRDRTDPRVTELLARGMQALRLALPDPRSQGVAYFREAIAIDPQSAPAWGGLAIALRQVAENSEPTNVAEVVRECETAARRALAIDPKEGNALTALATLRPAFGDWAGFEDRLNQVLAVAPDNEAALGELTLFLQGVGRCTESFEVNERRAQLAPLSPIVEQRRALKNWIFGRIALADQAADRALQIWPQHPAIWNARLYILAFTGRARAARAQVDDVATRPRTMTEATANYWRVTLRALETRAPADIAAAREMNLEAARAGTGRAVNAIMVMSALDVDTAFTITDGFLLRRGPLIPTLWLGRGDMPVNDLRWRRTMMLFTPPCAPLRADPRFAELCRGVGFTDYWRQRRIVPDHLRGLI